MSLEEAFDVAGNTVHIPERKVIRLASQVVGNHMCIEKDQMAIKILVTLFACCTR